MAVIIFMAMLSLRHGTNISATQEVEIAVKSSELGTVRNEATNAIDKEALVANLILEVVNAHKEQGKNIKIDYVFLNDKGKVTEVESEIHSVQFNVDILNEKGKTMSSSTQRVALIK